MKKIPGEYCFTATGESCSEFKRQLVRSDFEPYMESSKFGPIFALSNEKDVFLGPLPAFSKQEDQPGRVCRSSLSGFAFRGKKINLNPPYKGANSPLVHLYHLGLSYLIFRSIFVPISWPCARFTWYGCQEMRPLYLAGRTRFRRLSIGQPGIHFETVGMMNWVCRLSGTT